jgi:hypothetical protein
MRKLLTVATMLLAIACTKQQAVTAANAGVQLSVDLCKETGTTDGPLVALACAALESQQPDVTVMIDNAIWTSMKVSYLQMHGSLPAGMSAPKK